MTASVRWREQELELRRRSHRDTVQIAAHRLARSPQLDHLPVPRTFYGDPRAKTRQSLLRNSRTFPLQAITLSPWALYKFT